MNYEQYEKYVDELVADSMFEEMLNDPFCTSPIRKCESCAFGVGMESAVPCASHKWHIHPDAPWGIYIGALDDWDMCCLCGIDADSVMK